MNVLVIGATGGTGRASVHALLGRGHAVSVLARSEPDPPFPEGVRVERGDALVAADLDRALAGQDAAVVALGRGPNAFKTLLGIGQTTPPDLVARGTREVVAAMDRQGVRRAVVVTSFGVAESWASVSLGQRLFLGLFLKDEFRQKARQEDAVRASRADWTIIRPVQLTDGEASGDPLVSASGEVRGGSVPRADVGRVIAEAVADPATYGATLAVSG